MAIILLILALLYIFLFSGFTFTIGGWGGDVPGNTIDLLENPPPTLATCSLTLDKSSMNCGDTITGNYRTTGNDQCTAYGSLNGVWAKIADFTSNANGIGTTSTVLNLAGNYQFVILCSTCITNKANLNVQCTGTTIPGTTTIPDTTTSLPGETENCGTICSNAGYAGGRGPVDSPGRCNQGETYYTDNFDTSCCCSSGTTTTTQEADATTTTTSGAKGYICCRGWRDDYQCALKSCPLFYTQIGISYKDLRMCSLNCRAPATTTTTTIPTTTTLEPCQSYCQNVAPPNGPYHNWMPTSSSDTCHTTAQDDCPANLKAHHTDSTDCCCWSCWINGGWQ